MPSHNLTPYSYGSGQISASRQDRVLAGSIKRLECSKIYSLATIETRAQLEAARTHAVGYVGQQAMQAVAMVSQMEGQLGTLCPLAVSRLQAIADMTALTIAQVVGDAGRRLS